MGLLQPALIPYVPARHRRPPRARQVPLPRYESNARTGKASSNRTAHTSASGRRTSDPSDPMYATSNPAVGGPAEPP